MRILNVVNDGGRWFVTGFSDGSRFELHYRIPYPESEWPEIGKVKGEKEMMRALHDSWQTSDKLEAENKRHGGTGLYFHTPFGDFATYGFGLAAAHKVVEAANKLLLQQNEAKKRIETAVMSEHGFDPKTMKEIIAQYGTRFDDWPKDLVKRYWHANNLAIKRMNEIFA